MHKTPALLALLPILSSLLSSASPTSYAIWAADSAISRGQGNGTVKGSISVNYEHGEFQWALRQLYEVTSDEKYFNYIKHGIDSILNNDGTEISGYDVSDFQLDPMRVGPSFIYLHEKTNDTKYKNAAKILRDQLDIHPRSPAGQFWHKKIYPNQGWLDGLYMGDVFYAEYTKSYEPDNKTAWDDVNHQFTLMFNNTIQSETDDNYIGLPYHGYDASHTAIWASEDRGHSPEVWDRATGWLAMSLVDLVESIPTSQKLQSTALHQLRTIIPALAAQADPVWWLVMTQPGRDGNYYESSGAAMFVYSMLKAVRLGYIENGAEDVLSTAKMAYEYIVANWVVDNGDDTMDWLGTVEVGSLASSGDYEYYISQTVDTNDLKGLAAFVLASVEYEKL